MTDFIDASRRMVRASGHSPALIATSFALRVVERAFAIAPFFVGWYWLAQMPPFGAGLGTGARVWAVPLGWLAMLLAGQMLFSWLGQMSGFLGSYALTIAYRGRLVDHLRRLPLGVFTMAMRKFWLVLFAPMVVGVNTQVIFMESPGLARLISLPSGVK